MAMNGRLNVQFHNRVHVYFHIPHVFVVPHTVPTTINFLSLGVDSKLVCTTAFPRAYIGAWIVP